MPQALCLWHSIYKITISLLKSIFSSQLTKIFLNSKSLSKIKNLFSGASSVQKVSKNDSEEVISKIADKLPIIGFLSAFFVDLY